MIYVCADKMSCIKLDLIIQIQIQILNSPFLAHFQNDNKCV